MPQKILHRYDTKTNWTTHNPILGRGEWGYESDTEQYKIGNGTTAWNSLPYRGLPCIQQKGQSQVEAPSQKLFTDEVTRIDGSLVQLEQESVKSNSKNLYDVSKVKDKGAIRADGTITYTSTPDVFGVIFVPVTSLGVVVNKTQATGERYNALFDASLKCINGTITQANHMPYVSGAVYAGYSVKDYKTDKVIQIEAGDTPTLYEPYNPIYGYDVNIKQHSITSEELANSSVSKDKLQDSSVGFDKIELMSVGVDKMEDVEFFETKQTNVAYNCFAEFYSSKKYTSSAQHGTVGCKYYGGRLYFRPYSATYGYQYQCALDLNGKKNGEVYELKCTSTGEDSTVKIGDIVGYIIFSDIDKFRSIEDGSVGKKLYKRAINNEMYSPKIQSYITKKEIGESTIIKDGSITIDKLDENVKNSVLARYDVGLILPDIINATVGDNLQIFYRSIISASDVYGMDMGVIGQIGQPFPRYWQFCPSDEHVGRSFNVTFSLYGSAENVIASKTVIIVVNEKLKRDARNNILCVGASATANGYWVAELERRLKTTTGDGTFMNPTGVGLASFTTVGRKSVNGVKLEATGGWTVEDYAGQGLPAYRFEVKGVSTLSVGAVYSNSGFQFTIAEVNVTSGSGNIRCTYDGNPTIPASGALTKVSGAGDANILYSSYQLESYNPFWNNGRLDYVNYANLYCGGNIDTMVFHCGMNDIFKHDVNTIYMIIDSYRTILKSFHADFPTSKVIITSIPIGDIRGGFASNYGSSYSCHIQNYKVMVLASHLIAMCKDAEFSSFVYYCPAMEAFDAENAYPKVNVNVNNRIAVKEVIGSNAVHPTEDAAKMISDSVYRVLSSFDQN